MRKQIRAISLLIAATFAGAGAWVGCRSDAEEPTELSSPRGGESPAAGQERPPAGETREMTGMHQTMNECVQHCEQTLSAVDEADRALDEANRADDPAARSSALSRAQAELQEIKKHTSACMERMQGHEGMMSEKPRSQTSPPPTRPTPPERPSEHEGHEGGG